MGQSKIPLSATGFRSPRLKSFLQIRRIRKLLWIQASCMKLECWPRNKQHIPWRFYVQLRCVLTCLLFCLKEQIASEMSIGLGAELTALGLQTLTDQIIFLQPLQIMLSPWVRHCWRHHCAARFFAFAPLWSKAAWGILSEWLKYFWAHNKNSCHFLRKGFLHHIKSVIYGGK